MRAGPERGGSAAGRVVIQPPSNRLTCPVRSEGGGDATRAIRLRTLPAASSDLSLPPVHDHLARIARAGCGKRGLEVPETEAVRDRRSDIEPRLEHDRHLVPGLVHLATIDAPDREHLEDDLVQVESNL